MVDHETLSIKQLSTLAGVSVRTLHFYDQIGLLTPQRVRENNYRYYTRESLMRLQQILFYREMDLSLEQIGRILNDPAFDLISALQNHREALTDKAKRLTTLLQTIDNTIRNLKGQNEMTNGQFFNGFSEEQQAEYEKEAAQRWDPAVVGESSRRWKSLTKQEKEDLMAKGETIILALRDAMPKGPASPEAQKAIADWKQQISFFYDCSDEMLLNLGRMYLEDPRFKATYDRIHPDLAAFKYEAIQAYCAARGVTE